MPTENFTMTIQGLDELVANAKEAGSNISGLLTRAMVVSTTQISNDIKAAIIEQGITNTGTLGGSVSVIRADAGQGIVGVGEQYGAYVEFGTGPHFPPIDAIERWAQTKLGQPGLGFIIARKISQVGTKAKPFVQPSFEKNVDFVQEQFADVAQQLVVKLSE